MEDSNSDIVQANPYAAIKDGVEDINLDGILTIFEERATDHQSSTVAWQQQKAHTQYKLECVQVKEKERETGEVKVDPADIPTIPLSPSIPRPVSIRERAK